MKQVIIGIALGDQAGISSEIVAAALREKRDYAAVLFGNYDWFCRLGGNLLDVTVLRDYKREELTGNGCYFVDLAAGGDIAPGKITGDSGRLIYDGIAKAIEFQKAGKVDGIVMAPITKEALHKSGLSYSSEFELFADLYQTKDVRAVIRCENIFRATVVGHCAFREIPDRLTSAGIVQTGEALMSVIRRFKPGKECSIAVAALNPHAGENGLFGDEEGRIIAPAVEKLNREGIPAVGPCPADTVFLRAVDGRNDGVLFLYHDQGNIAMKSRFFGDGVLIYTNVPTVICSVGHGSALDIAGKGVADPSNMELCIATAVELCRKEN